MYSTRVVIPAMVSCSVYLSMYFLEMLIQEQNVSINLQTKQTLLVRELLSQPWLVMFLHCDVLSGNAYSRIQCNFTNETKIICHFVMIL